MNFQLIWGVGVPSMIGYEALVWGVVLKSQYYIPTTGIGSISTDDLKPVDWPGLIIERKRRSYPEKALTRWVLYEALAQMTQK